MKPQIVNSLASAILGQSVLTEITDFASHCRSSVELLSAQLDASTVVNSALYYPVGAEISIATKDPTCVPFDDLERISEFEFCRIQMTTESSSSSSFNTEIWLPSNWTGRFLVTGNGGIEGCIHRFEMIYAAARGFASIGNDSGHTGQTAKYFTNKEVLKDYVYRAMHMGVALGKKVTAAFYGQPHTKSYYLGCSTGGRQAFTEAQRYPEDFDGIIGGAPAFSFTGLTLWAGRFSTITGPPGSPTFLTPELWDIVHGDVIKQCDGLDGYEDGVIEDPDLCQYKPEHLLCSASGHNAGRCLTATQLNTVRAVFSPMYGGNGELAYPRLPPGANSTFFYYVGAQFPITTEWMRYVVYDDPTSSGNIGIKELTDAQAAQPYGLDSYNPDLSGVRDAGVKVLHYHGLQDFVISSEASSRYYNLVSEKMAMSPSELDEFYRYFPISGMAHCYDGNGAMNIGNREDTLGGEDPENNVLWAIVAWVEQGKAPETITGTAYADKDKTQVLFQRKHCKYPKRNRYKGSGDPNNADSWECVLNASLK